MDGVQPDEQLLPDEHEEEEQDDEDDEQLLDDEEHEELLLEQLGAEGALHDGADGAAQLGAAGAAGTKSATDGVMEKGLDESTAEGDGVAWYGDMAGHIDTHGAKMTVGSDEEHPEPPDDPSLGFLPNSFS